jgi:hypothetical protein
MTGLHLSVCAGQTVSRLGESNPRPTHYERVTMRCYRGRDATDVAVRKVQLLAVVGCSRSFGGTTGARLCYLCHTVLAALSWEALNR